MKTPPPKRPAAASAIGRSPMAMHAAWVALGDMGH